MKSRERTERLKLVFALKEPTEPKELVQLGDQTFTFQRREPSVAPMDALHRLLAVTEELGMNSTLFENGPPLYTVALEKVERKGRWGSLETADLDFRYGVVPNYGHCFVAIKEKLPGAGMGWDTWVASFLSAYKAQFVQAWVCDVEYDHWQNAQDPLFYNAAGRDYSHLPMKSNNLPPPLDRMEIDISKNPGRWSLQSGYVEAIGATMWLGDMFWNYVGRDRRDRVLSNDWVHATFVADDVIKLQPSSQSFISEDSADIQNRLRELLYGNT